MNTSALINFLNSLERQGILASVANSRIQEFLSFSHRSLGKLFLTYSAVMGALFVSAGIFAIIAHNWDDLGQHVQGTLSFVPSLIALYIYYIAIFKYGHKTSYVEGASLFLMLMIGASIALISQVYKMDGDFDKFVIIWLCLTIPLFYIARASGIAFFYLLLTLRFANPNWDWGFLVLNGYDLNERYWLFWVFFLAYIPHFYLALNKNSNHQGFRAIYLGWITAIFFILCLPFIVKAGYLWWGCSTFLGFYLIGKKYYGDNISSLGRPFQTFTLLALCIFLLMLSADWMYRFIFRHEGIRLMDTWGKEEFLFYVLGVILLISLTWLAIREKAKGAHLNRYVIFAPFLIVFLYGIYCLNQLGSFDIQWLSFLVLNFYILFFAINSMIQGKKSGSVLYMFYGLFIATFLLWMRYYDMDVWFWLKGLIFIGVGFIFFIIHYLSADEFEE